MFFKIVNARTLITLLSGLLFLTFIVSGCEKSLEKPTDGMKKIWDVQVGEKVEGNLLAAEGLVFMVSDENKIIALNGKTGKTAWKKTASEKYFWEHSLGYGQGKVFLGAAGGVVYALEAKTGKQVWKKSLGMDMNLSPLLHEGTLYVATTRHWPPRLKVNKTTASVFVLDPATGKVKHEIKTKNYVLQTPATDGTNLYIAGSRQKEHATIKQTKKDEGGFNITRAFDIKNNFKQVWATEAYEGFIKIVMAKNGLVQTIGYEDYIVTLDAKTGKRKWIHRTGNWTPGFVYDDGKLFFGAANRKIAAINQKTGQREWLYVTPNKRVLSYIQGNPIVKDGILYFIMRESRKFGALKAASGKELWLQETGIKGFRIMEPVIDSENRVYIATLEGYIHAYQLKEKGGKTQKK